MICYITLKERVYTLIAKCLNPIKVAVLPLFINSHMLIHQIKMTANMLNVEASKYCILLLVRIVVCMFWFLYFHMVYINTSIDINLKRWPDLFSES